MRLRKILIAGSAIAAAAALALVPAAQATTPGGNVGSIRVGANTTGNHPVTGTLKSGISVTMNVYGSPTKFTCSSGTLAGVVHAGSPAPSPAFTFTTLSLTCDSFIPDTIVTITLPGSGCANWTWSASALVHDGLSDLGPKGGKFQEVLGVFNLFTGCYVTMTAGPCTVTIGGSTTSNFYEAKSSTVATQGLNLKSSGLTVKSASFLCLGAVSAGSALTMNLVDFNINSVDGAIDFRDTP
jgi:hypothetical protein